MFRRLLSPVCTIQSFSTASYVKFLYTFALLVVLSIGGNAQELNPSQRDAISLEKKGDLDGAVQILKKSQQEIPDDPQTAKLLGRDYVLKVDDQPDVDKKKEYGQRGLDLSKKAADALPQDAEAQIGVAAAYGKLCDVVDPKTKVEYSKSVFSNVTRGLQLDPNSDFGHLILARWHFEMSILNPLLKAFAQMVYGRFPAASKEDAIANFKRAIEIAPQRIVHHAEYAHALDVFGDKEGARKEWQKVTGLKPVYAQDRRYQEQAVAKLGS
jgi:tetratricopeptide (TPR) repeat protein